MPYADQPFTSEARANKALQLTARQHASQEFFPRCLKADRAPQLKAVVPLLTNHEKNTPNPCALFIPDVRCLRTVSFPG